MQRKKTFNALSTLRAALLSVLMSFCVTAAFAQQGTVKGTVIDDTGEPIIGANVVEKGTTNGAITDIDGNYTLQVTNLKSASLEFSFIGYNTLEEKINGRATINVTLSSGVINLGEVIAIGYGTQTRREITGSVANVDQATFNKGISRDASDLLRGKVAGLNITQGSSDVTRGSQIRLRGTSTLMNDQGPMIVIDGVPGGDMSTVAPADIESISVLKDASSQAIYGSRAAGGVILITTKKGTGAKTTINYDGYVSADVAANKPDMLSSQEWIDLNNQLGNQEKIKEIVGAWDGKTNTNWFDEILRTGISQNHSLSMTGGTSTSNYRASYTYLDRQGVSKVNYMRRHSFRFQVQQRALDNRLRLTLTAAGTMQDSNSPFQEDFVRAYNMLPLYPVYNADGSFYEGANGLLFNEYDMGNPVHAEAENYNRSKKNNFYGQGEVQFDIMEGLNVKANLYKSRFSTDNSVWKAPTNYQSSSGDATRSANTANRTMMELTANFDKTFGNHKVGALIGYSWENNEYESQYAASSNYAVTSMGANSIQAGQELKIGNVTSGHNSYKLISFFGRATYSYKERYMVTGTLRRDGSSKFGANHKWGTFPSGSAAWGISQEPFMKNVKWVDDLKLRAGYGITGNQDGLSPYKSLQLYQAYGTYVSGGSNLSAFRVSQNANPDLKWEQTSMFNIGLDFSLFKGRLGGTIEYYDKRTKDMLYNYRVPTPTYVYSSIAANVGDMSNKGIEVSLNFDAIHTKNFNWTTTLNLSHNKNEITKLSNDLYSTSRVFVGDPWIRGQSGATSHVVEEGRPVGQFYVLHVTKYDEKTGHFEYWDKNNDGTISDDDRTYAGDAQPDLEFGWSNNFTYKNWDASFFIRGSIGQKALNNPIAAYGTNNYITGTNAMKSPFLTTLNESVKVCDYFIEDASYARLDNMTIGYTFNTKKLNWLDKARVYVTAQNLFVITGYKGLDPEVEVYRGAASDSNAGLDPGIEPRQYFPKARTFTFGVNLTF